MDAYKTVCSHFIQSSATPTIEKLGLAPLLETRGAVHNSVDLWTRDSGWIVANGDAPYGYSVTRRTLDPILRKLAAETPGVELLTGWSAVGLPSGGQPAGVAIENRGHADPLWGIGCGWAFQSADWLVEETADALDAGGDLDTALERYKRVHRRRLLPHYLMISDIASGRPINPIERRLYSVAARDPVMLRAFEEVGSRRRSPARMLDPRVLARLAR